MTKTKIQKIAIILLYSITNKQFWLSKIGANILYFIDLCYWYCFEISIDLQYSLFNTKIIMKNLFVLFD